MSEAVKESIVTPRWDGSKWRPNLVAMDTTQSCNCVSRFDADGVSVAFLYVFRKRRGGSCNDTVSVTWNELMFARSITSSVFRGSRWAILQLTETRRHLIVHSTEDDFFQWQKSFQLFMVPVVQIGRKKKAFSESIKIYAKPNEPRSKLSWRSWIYNWNH